MRQDTSRTTSYRYANSEVEIQSDLGGNPEAVLTVQAQGMPLFALLMDPESLTDLIEKLNQASEEIHASS